MVDQIYYKIVFFGVCDVSFVYSSWFVVLGYVFGICLKIISARLMISCSLNTSVWISKSDKWHNYRLHPVFPFVAGNKTIIKECFFRLGMEALNARISACNLSMKAVTHLLGLCSKKANQSISEEILFRLIQNYLFCCYF